MTPPALVALSALATLGTGTLGYVLGASAATTGRLAQLRRRGVATGTVEIAAPMALDAATFRPNTVPGTAARQGTAEVELDELLGIVAADRQGASEARPAASSIVSSTSAVPDTDRASSPLQSREVWVSDGTGGAMRIAFRSQAGAEPSL